LAKSTGFIKTGIPVSAKSTGFIKTGISVLAKIADYSKTNKIADYSYFKLFLL
jgi:hypothetical protein